MIYTIFTSIGVAGFSGLLTFIHKDTHYGNFSSEKEVIFYSNLSDLSEKIQKYARDDSMRKKIARNGKKKYMKFFNSTIVAEYIINNTFDLKIKKDKYMWVKK